MTFLLNFPRGCFLQEIGHRKFHAFYRISRVYLRTFMKKAVSNQKIGEYKSYLPGEIRILKTEA